MKTPLHETPENDERQLMLTRLQKGCVLLSREELRDTNFMNSVVLLCMYGDEGAFGLIINRPTHMPVQEVFNVERWQYDTTVKLYVGGPVQDNALQIIQLTSTPVKNAFEIYPQVYFGGEWEDLEAILHADTSTTRLFLGYSGWGNGQLEAEIAAGAWDVFNLHVPTILNEDDEVLKKPVSQLRSYLQRRHTEYSNSA